MGTNLREVRQTACNRDCPDVCTLEVTVESGRAIKLKGSQADPITQGFLCQRTSRFLERQYAEDRILKPRLRKGDRWFDLDWDEALDLVADKMTTYRDQDGAASLLHYRSGGSLGLLKSVADVLFAQFGPVTIKHGDICSGAGEWAQAQDFGVSESHDIEDLLHSKTIILWGKNPFVSGVHLLPLLKQAKKNGAKILGIDPIRTQVTSLCDQFLWPRPGTDFEVAMGVARWLFENERVDANASEYCDHFDAFREMVMGATCQERAERADISLEELHKFAKAYGDGKPAALLVGWGLGRRGNGASTIRALDALGAVSGNLGIRGGGVSYYFGRRTAFESDYGLDLPSPPRTFSEPLLGEQILGAKDPPIRMIWVTAGNPISMLPDSTQVRKAFDETSFKVVVDTHPTDTTDYADLVLPTLTLLEDDDLLGAYGNHYLRVSRPTLPPPGEARHEIDILSGLAKRLGLDTCGPKGLWDQTPRQWKQRAMTRLEAAGISLETLEEKGAVLNPFRKEVLFEGNRFPTSNGKFQLLETPAMVTPPPTPEYPMTLLAVSTPRAQSSQWSVDPGNGPPEVKVHPSHLVDIQEGEIAILESSIRSMKVKVVSDDRVRPEIALMEKGGMMRQGRCVNELIKASETDRGEGASYYDQSVRLRSLD